MEKKTNKFGQSILNEDGILELLYSGNLDFSSFFVEDKKFVKQYNTNALIFGEPKLLIHTESNKTIEEFDKEKQSIWFVPEKYLNIDVEQYIKKLCKTKEQLNRVEEELNLFNKHNMLIVIKVLIYLIDVMREHKIVWGVGRGSSCASYCLFLIGLHKVDCLKYNIEITEFLRDK